MRFSFVSAPRIPASSTANAAAWSSEAYGVLCPKFEVAFPFALFTAHAHVHVPPARVWRIV